MQKAELETKYKDQYGGVWGAIKSAFTSEDKQMEEAMKTLDRQINALIQEQLNTILE